MNKLILYPLFLLFLISVFTQMLNTGGASFGYGGETGEEITGNQTLTGEESELELDNAELSLDFTMTTGLVAVIAGAIALGLIGIKVLGSGLDSYSIKIIWNGIVFYGLWSIFSVLAFNAISSIWLGSIFWFLLTFIYSLGVFSRMGN